MRKEKGRRGREKKNGENPILRPQDNLDRLSCHAAAPPNPIGRPAQSAQQHGSSRTSRAEESRIADEGVRLQRNFDYVEREEQHLGEEKQAVSKGIMTQCGPFQKELAKVEEEHAALLGEIAELEARLEAKWQRERQCSGIKQESSIKIAAIKGKFQRQLDRIEAGQERLGESKTENAHDKQVQGWSVTLALVAVYILLGNGYSF